MGCISLFFSFLLLYEATEKKERELVERERERVRAMQSDTPSFFFLEDQEIRNKKKSSIGKERRRKLRRRKSSKELGCSFKKKILLYIDSYFK